MKKNILAFVLFALSTTLVSAQWTVGVAYQIGFPGKQMYSSDMSNSYVGFNGKVKYSFDDYLKANIGIGYYAVPFDKLRIDETQIPITGLTLTMIPVTLGGEFFFLEQKEDAHQQFKPFVGLDLGYTFTMQPKSDYTPAINRNNFIVAPTFGIAYVFNDNIEFFASARQNIFIYEFKDLSNYNSTFSLFGLNLGMNYQF